MKTEATRASTHGGGLSNFMTNMQKQGANNSKKRNIDEVPQGRFRFKF